MPLWNEIAWLNEVLPESIRGTVIRPFSSKLRRIAYGGKKFDFSLRTLEDLEKKDSYEYQYRKLIEMLSHCKENVPFYSKRYEGINIRGIKSIEDMDVLPEITKKDVLDNYHSLFSKRVLFKPRVYRDTSGTTGPAVRYYLDDHIISMVAAGHTILRRWAGYSFEGRPVLYAPVANPTTYLSSAKKSYYAFKSPIINGIKYSHNFIDDATFRSYTNNIKRYGIRNIEGFPSIIYEFSNYLKRNKIDLNLETVRIYSEADSFKRKMISRQMNCEVFNLYGSAESVVFAQECKRHTGMHIMPFGIAELKDQGLSGRGEMLMTSIENKTFPLIRYNIKDIVNINKRKCTCGCYWPRITQIEGRNNDFLYLPDGQKLHPMSFAFIPRSIRQIKDLQIIQNADYTLSISIVKSDSTDEEKILKKVQDKINSLSEGRLEAQIIFVERIERKKRKHSVVQTLIR